MRLGNEGCSDHDLTSFEILFNGFVVAHGKCIDYDIKPVVL